ncbi:MAG: hypothetical protein U1F56_16500 [Rubrivivax sp.]
MPSPRHHADLRTVQRAPAPAHALPALEALRDLPGAAGADARREPLARLAAATLRSAAEVLRLHECLCWLRAYAGGHAERAQVASMLDGFADRVDLQRHRRALADSGIAGTDTRYRFFWGQALWLATRWPAQLALDRRAGADAAPRLARALPVLVTHVEMQALVELHLDGFDAIDRLRDAGTSDAVFLQRRIEAMPGDGFTREAFSDAIDATYVLRAGPGTPSRSTAFFAPAPRVPGSAPRRGRADLRAELARAPRRVRALARRDARAAIDLARAAMVLRARSLEAFSFADARDAWLVDDGDGLSFVFVGVVPERRQTIATVCGGLTLRNGVPIGYVQADIVGATAALSFNTFETFRAGEAGYTFARWLAALHHVHGVRSFSIEPYQLGQGNDEALDSGAWWFYAKMGFEPREPAVQGLAQAERRRLAQHPGARSGRRTLQALASVHLLFEADPAQPHPLPPQQGLGLVAAQALSARAAADRDAAQAACERDARRALGLTSLAGFSAAERQAWRRWAPLLAMLPLDRWSATERADLVALVRAKAARSEAGFVRAWQRHPKLDAALRALLPAR